MEMNPIVSCQQVTYRYGKKLAINQLTASFPQGQAIGLLGENGAGKSTLLKLITGIMQPNAGQIKVFGETPNWQTLKRISYLGDRAQWYKFHRIQEAIQFAQQLCPNFQLSRAEHYLEFLKLNPQDFVESLSKGQMMRLQLLLCLSRDVDLYILDEPFSGIDLISREKIIELLIELLAERTATFIISTHEIYETEGLFEYVFLLKNGKIVKKGKTDQLRAELGSIQNVYREVFR